MRHSQNKKKYMRQMIAFDLIFPLAYTFLFFLHVVPSKIYSEKKFTTFFGHFAPFKLKKGLIFGILILYLCSKWLLNAFNIYFIYFEWKQIIFIFKLLGFLRSNSKISQNRAYFGQNSYIYFFAFFFKDRYGILIYLMLSVVFLAMKHNKPH